VSVQPLHVFRYRIRTIETSHCCTACTRFPPHRERVTYELGFQSTTELGLVAFSLIFFIFSYYVKIFVPQAEAKTGGLTATTISAVLL